MNVTILQTNICWKNAKTNRDNAEKLMGFYPGTALFVLPEMFTTGFCTGRDSEAEAMEGETLRWMRTMAARHGSAIAGSIAVREGGRNYNRFLFVRPDGGCLFYDKRHLFTCGGEKENYTPGHGRVVVSHGGFRILLQVCYDLRFPVWSRCRSDYDLIVYVANWPASRREVWDVLLRARALENQCFVVGVNRVGSDPVCRYDGGSVVISPYGKVIAACGDGKEEGASVSLSRDLLDDFRARFPVLADADRFSLPDLLP